MPDLKKKTEENRGQDATNSVNNPGNKTSNN
jgi:hypothetical protein